MKKAFIEIIGPEDAEGLLKRAYRRIGGKRGSIAYVHQSQSLNPKVMMTHLDLYMTLMYEDSPLSRKQRELIGVITSYYNKCGYCITHHYEALKMYWENAESIEGIINNNGLSNQDKVIAKFTKNLTLNPHENSETDVEMLRTSGFNDRAILDIILIVSYFGFVNRLVLATGIKLENKEERNYKY